MRHFICTLLAGVVLGGLISCRQSVPLPPPYVPVAPLETATPPPPIEPQVITPAPPSTAAPTLMARVPGGYELKNDRVRVVISDTTGDVTFWGSPGGRNLLLQPGIVVRLTGMPASMPTGYIEARDQQTWQFYGSDANHITWRKIYCLDGHNLLASFVYQNDGKTPIDNAEQLIGNLVGVRVRLHAVDHFAGASAFGDVSLRGFNENHGPSSRPVFPVLLQSDSRRCAPGERQSFTTEWQLDGEP